MNNRPAHPLARLSKTKQNKPLPSLPSLPSKTAVDRSNQRPVTSPPVRSGLVSSKVETVDEDFHSPLTVQEDTPTTPEPEAEELQEPSKPAGTTAAEQKAVTAKKMPKYSTLVFNETDRTMGLSIDKYGVLTGSHLALSVNKPYTNKKGRFAKLEREGLLTSKLAYGIKIYNSTKKGNERLMLDKKPAPFPDRSKWRHSFIVATQGITMETTKPGEKQKLLDGKMTGPVPVIPESVVVDHAASLTVDVTQKAWRGDCLEVLSDNSYPVVNHDSPAVLEMTKEDRDEVEQYWKTERGGRACSLFIHWDDKFAFGGKKRADRSREVYHRRRADAIVARPHIRLPDGSVKGASIAVEVELTRKDIPEYERIILQWFDHPLIGKLVYLIDKPIVASSVNTAAKRIIESGAITREEMSNFLSIRKPAFVNKHLDSEGYFG